MDDRPRKLRRGRLWWRFFHRQPEVGHRPFRCLQGCVVKKRDHIVSGSPDAEKKLLIPADIIEKRIIKNRELLGKEDILEYAKNKRKMRNYANSCHKFIAQPDLMPVIGRSWGIVLGPRSKMPQPLPPKVPIEPIMNRLKNTVNIISKKNPTIHAPIGTENMSAGDLAENAMAVMDAIGRQITDDKIGSVYVKKTMGEPVKVQ